MSRLDDRGFFLEAVYDEFDRAEKKFPSTHCALAALMEEVGELAQAMLHFHLEGKGSEMQIKKEAVQVAVMAMRIALDGDPSIRHPILSAK